MFTTLLPHPDVATKLLDTIIMSPTGRRSMSRLARTCKAMCEPALNVLWRELDSLLPLISLFPDNIFKRARRPGLGLAKAPNLEDWDRVLAYGERVRRIVYIESSPSVSPSIFAAITESPVPYIFPHLQTLIWRVDTAAGLDRSTLFLNPELQSLILEVGTRIPQLGAYLASVCSHTQLTAFSFTSPTSLPRTFTDLVRSQNTLEKLALVAPGSLSSQVGQWAASLPALHTLELDLTGRSIIAVEGFFDDIVSAGVATPSDASSGIFTDDEIDFAENKKSSLRFTRDLHSCGVFTNLRNLQLTGEIANIAVFLKHLTSPLTSLELVIEDPPDMADWQDLSVLICEQFSRTLLSVRIGATGASRFTELVRATSRVATDQPSRHLPLQYFSFLPALICLEIDLPESTLFSNEDLRHIARACPAIETLRLCPMARFSGSSSPNLTLEGVAALTQKCKRLQNLSLVLDARQGSAETLSALDVSSRSLLRLHVGHSNVNDPLHTTILLSHLAPHLESLRWFYEKNRPGYVEANAQGWQKVSDWLPQLQGMRLMERAKASTPRDISTHTQIRDPQDISSIAVAPGDQFLTTGGKDVMKSLHCINAFAHDQGQQDGQPSISADHDDDPHVSTPEAFKFSRLLRITDSILSSPLHLTFKELDLQIDDATLDLWKQNLLPNAETLLTTAITTSQDASYHLFAGRALVRARLRDWDAAVLDAEKAIEIQPSVTGYIAKSIALAGKGERHASYRTCDVAFARSHSSHVTFLLLIKAIIVFMAGEHLDAISRVDDLAAVTSDSICYVVQGYMHLLLGNLHMEYSDYEGAIESFKHAQAQMRHHGSQLLLMISLIFGWQFDNVHVTLWQRLCDALYAAGRIEDAAECFHKMTSELEKEADLQDDCPEWTLGFRQRCCEKLVHLGDVSVDSQRKEEAISHYTTALLLNPPTPQSTLMKRGKVFLTTGSWEQALDDANQVITLDPSSPWAYEVKHAALHGAGEYDDAVNAFEVMLSKMAQSPNPVIQQHSDQYISPSTTRATIHRIVQRTVRHSPRVLINTATGRLYDRAEQASVFDSLPIFNELVSSMTKRIDYVRIKHEIRHYFRYVMLSHKWENNEPLFQKVIHVAVYDLDESPTHDKLQTFCKIVRDAGINWAWSDTCCIDKSDHFVLQEALVAMFKWYQGCAMVIVFLRGVRSSSQLGALVKSIWNTRAWTLQEYIAAKIIHFYTEDWTLYLDLGLQNHKESQEVISEMEQATGVSADRLMSLRPGLTSVREKLRLASTRRTTLVEDAAYSLLGIFSVTGIPAIYGEGEGSLGRLLAHVLTGSGDVSILAWTGESGSFNSCLPAYITVFDGPATSHLPPPIPDAEMERIITTSSINLDMALTLYDHLNKLPAPWFAATRMKLPCIAFQLPPLSTYRTRSGRLYRADVPTFGRVGITTRQDLSRMKSLYLIHPWLDALLEQEGIHSDAFMRDDVVPPPSPDDAEIPDDEFGDDSLLLPEPESPLHATSEHVVPMDRETRARRFVARLRQPFGALLLTPVVSGRRGTDYRRVAADSLIRVQFQENVSLVDILDNVQTLDIL